MNAGVGCKMNQQLREMGVTTVQQLRTFTEAQLVRTFGATNGHMLAQNALYVTSSNTSCVLLCPQLCDCKLMLYCHVLASVRAVHVASEKSEWYSGAIRPMLDNMLILGNVRTALSSKTACSICSKGRTKDEVLSHIIDGQYFGYRGKDDIAVMASGVPKSITCEDSFKSCSSFDAVATVVRSSCTIRNIFYTFCTLTGILH